MIDTPSTASRPRPEPHGPVPSPRQLAWHAIEFYGFLHFTVNTFTDQEWGYGDESPGVFCPTAFDADQIAQTAKAAGMGGLILTCKHHDGFCLWPSQFTTHSVAHSPWRDGSGDVVQEISDACRRHDLRFGIYLSPWDRNHPDYGTPAYLTYYRNQLRELLTHYDSLFEVWFDGANGGDGYYGGARETRHIDKETYYGWERTWQLVRELQPQACIFSDAGPDVRWVGNEKGIAGDPCWATLNRRGIVPGSADASHLNAGDRQGTDWVPAECDVSIRPGWFYHPIENDQVRSAANLFDLYFRSVGRGASLLLNLPPDRRGQIYENDVVALQGFQSLVARTFDADLARSALSVHGRSWLNDPHYSAARTIDGDRETYWYPGKEEKSDLTLTFARPVQFNVVSLREYLPLGQRVEAFTLESWQGDGWSHFARGTSIGNRRLVRTPTDIVTDRIRLRITRASAGPALSQLGLFVAPASQTAESR